MPTLTTDYEPGRVTSTVPYSGAAGGGGGMAGIGGLLNQVAARRAWEREQAERAAQEERDFRMKMMEREAALRERAMLQARAQAGGGGGMTGGGGGRAIEQPEPVRGATLPYMPMSGSTGAFQNYGTGVTTDPMAIQRGFLV